MDFERNSDILKAIGHPIRLRILQGLMATRECNVNKMVENLKIPQSTASQHLSILRNKGIISPRKEGVKVCYRITNPLVAKIMENMEKGE